MIRQAAFKVLVLAENEADYFFVRDLLSVSESHRFEANWVSTPARAQEAVEQNGYHVCLVEIPAGPPSRLEFLRDELVNAWPVPMIVLTGQRTFDADLEAIQLGVADLLVKEQLTAPLLERAIQVAMERQRAQYKLQLGNDDLAFLARAGAAFVSSLDLDEVLASVLEELTERLQVASSFWLVDPATDELVCRKASGPFAHLVVNLRLRPGQGIAGWVVQHNASLIVSDAAKDSRHCAEVDSKMATAYRSILCVPLRCRQKVIGALQMLDVKANHFGLADRMLAESLASTAAIAIENARLYQQAQVDLIARQDALADLERTSAQLAASEVRLRTIIDADLHGVIVVDLQGVIRFVNPATQALLGRSSEQLLGEVFGFPVVADAATELELLLPDGQYSNVEMRAVKIDWEGSPCFLASLYDISERKQLEKALRELSLRDGLTDLLNQRGFLLMGEQLLAMARRQEKSVVLLFADMDGLKGINDNLGHQVGDQALISVAKILRESFRGTDVIARLGGDEFAILALQSDAVGTETMQAGLRSNIEKANAQSQSAFRIELSIGATLCDPKKPQTLAQLLLMADEQMYRNKRSKKLVAQAPAIPAD